ncbi:MAG TPA: amino acid adenylation domain-containing protein [Thermoanaerobaculia bacterium]|jgi:amino acid adenylation domain-containing protein|nr:amino acid adenylation domain-containing protein [Thermoanaerobaculia bacterium]
MSGTMQGFRLSPQQRRIWQLARDSRAFRVQALVTLDGPPEVVAAETVRAALWAVVARTEILRTTYRRSPGVRFPLQVVVEDLPPLWQVAEPGTEPEALFAKALARPFDLERGPVVHATWVPLGSGRAALILALPAIAADLQALDHLIANLERELAAPTSAEEPVQYVQVSEWANELLASDESRAGREYFRARDLSPLFGLTLPLEGRAAGGFAPERLAVEVGPEVSARAAALAAEWGIEERALLLAAWSALLARMSGSGEVGVGVQLDGRSHPDLADALGTFARTVPQLARIDDARTLRQLSGEIAAALSEAVDWQDCFSTEEEDRYGTGFPAAFSYRRPALPGGGLVAVERRIGNLERWKLALEAERGPAGLSFVLGYDSRIFSAEAAATQGERFGAFLGALLAAPDAPIGDPDLLTERERGRLAAFNATAAPFPAGTVADLFVAQARATPSRIALKSGSDELTYADLLARTQRQANALSAAGAGPGSVVAILAERSIEMVVGILGALRAGAAYLPLDTAYPRERLAFMLEDSGADLVLAQESLFGLLPAERAISPRTLALDSPPGTDPGAISLRPAGPNDLAYVLYTSGSTGKPKGVMVPHRGLVNYLHWAIGAYDAGAGAAPVHSPIGFDLTVTGLFAPLLSGGTVELLAEDRGVESLAETLRAGAGYALVKLTPAHLALLGPLAAKGEPAAWAKTLVVGGEALAGETLAAWSKGAPEVRIVNEYGPTETVVGCAVYAARAGDVAPGPVPIGRPIANARLHLLDPRGRPVPEGVPGEIYIGGAGIARGYLGRPDLTAERFVPDPFAADAAESAEAGARLYRSGDLARLLPSGDLEFLGRNDHQVKIRGVRLELGEIEAALAGAPGVREGAVLAREDRPGERRLVAYYTTDREPAPNVDELRRHLAATLPETSVPAIFLRLPALPLTANGKLDRAALPAPGNARPDLEREYVAPRNEAETALVEIWAEVLGIDRIGVEDSFFAVGGDSIRSVRVIALAKERGIELSVEELFRHPTVAALAEQAARTAAAAESGAGSTGEEESLAALVAELEGLSDEEVAARLSAEGGELLIAALDSTGRASDRPAARPARGRVSRG